MLIEYKTLIVLGFLELIDGQTVSKRLLKSLKKASNGLKVELKIYNEMAFTSNDDHLPNSLTWEEVADPDAALYRKMEEKVLHIYQYIFIKLLYLITSHCGQLEWKDEHKN